VKAWSSDKNANVKAEGAAPSVNQNASASATLDSRQPEEAARAEIEIIMVFCVFDIFNVRCSQAKPSYPGSSNSGTTSTLKRAKACLILW